MSRGPVRVLLVEDDEDDFVLTRQCLRDIDPEAFDLEWAPDFDDAIRLLVGGGYDVCLVDYQLGERNGVEFITAAVDAGVGAPIILLTGQGDRAVDMAAMNAGAADFLHKVQLSAALLERSIRYSIQQKKAEQQRIRLLMEQAARAEAEAASRSKDQFLAVLSHELRTPLSAVLMSVSALDQESELPPKLRDLVGIIKRNAELEARLIDDLLDLTRVTRGKLELRREAVDLHVQIHDAIHTCCGSDIEGKHLRIESRTEATQHVVWGDPARLQQVLWNLIKNSVKFTPEHGTIQIQTRNDMPGKVRIEVSDTGIGIQPDALPKIFNAFEQVDRAITRRFGGLGLGLAICKALVELHGGTITAVSEGDGRGATFAIDLPIANQPAPAQTDGAPQQSSESQGISLLLVEDHPDTAMLMQRLLTRRGYRIRAASTMNEALHIAETEAFDLIVSDIGLPDGSGLELIKRLRERGPVRGIALSGFGMEEDLERSRIAGFAEHLTKPIDLRQLEAAIHRVARPASPSPVVATSTAGR